MPIFGRSQVNQVFTPRRNEVNHEIYVERPDLEKELRRAILGSQHPIVYGESGSGKSWLYKKVLEDLKATVAIANSASAQRFSSLTQEIRHAVGLGEALILKGMRQTIEAGADVVVARGGATSTREYEQLAGDPLHEAFSKLRKEAGTGPAVLVIDNLEIVVSSAELMTELASIVALLDDQRFAKHNIKLLLVGVPSVMRDYFLKTPSAQSIANRLVEVSEVSKLDATQVRQLVAKGFRDLLKVEIDDADLVTWQDHILNVTLGFPQPVQEYCEQLGYLAEDANWKGTVGQLREADSRWLKQSLNYASAHVAARMNERETKAGRRNQVLFALGKIAVRNFSVAHVESIVRTEFPESTADTALAIGQILAELASGTHPIIKTSVATGEYEFRDAKFAMALRVFLEKDPEREKVRRKDGPQEELAP